jgi:hypothetical protein
MAPKSHLRHLSREVLERSSALGTEEHVSCVAEFESGEEEYRVARTKSREDWQRNEPARI